MSLIRVIPHFGPRARDLLHVPSAGRIESIDRCGSMWWCGSAVSREAYDMNTEFYGLMVNMVLHAATTAVGWFLFNE